MVATHLTCWLWKRVAAPLALPRVKAEPTTSGVGASQANAEGGGAVPVLCNWRL